MPWLYSERKPEGDVQCAKRFALATVGIPAVIHAQRTDGQLVSNAQADGISQLGQLYGINKIVGGTNPAHVAKQGEFEIWLHLIREFHTCDITDQPTQGRPA